MSAGKTKGKKTGMNGGHAAYPARIVCLSEETTETLYLLGQQERIVGISGYTVRPPVARREKPKIAAFTTAKIDKILALRPDLVLGFSDLQADIAAALIRHGVAVHIFNQRTIQGILDMVLLLGAMVGAAGNARQLVDSLNTRLDVVRAQTARLSLRPRVYFEEWDSPLITGIRWTSELIELAGGEDCFAERALRPDARGRIIEDSDEVIRAQPDIIIGSWCGKRFRPEQLAARPGWDSIPAVRDGELHEIKSPLILQPGPAALTDGLNALQQIIESWVAARLAETVGAAEQ